MSQRTINGTGLWVLRVSVAAPSGVEMTQAMVVCKDMVSRFNGRRPLALVDNELDRLSRNVVGAIREELEKADPVYRCGGKEGE